MASDLPLVRLGDYVDACLGKMLDAQKNRGKLQPYLGNSNVRWGAFDLEDLAVMRFEEHEDERYGIRDGDLIVCEGGEPGRCAIWRGDTPMKIQKALHRVRTKDGLDSHFLYYWFLRAGRTGELEPFFTGTTIKHLTGRALAELRIPLLPIESQREVAKVLRSIDAKIDLNRRINQTLEAMAQAIFQSWFVDFDPVKAKIAATAEGRDPLRAAMSAISGKADAELDALSPERYEQLAATAALFPDEMEASELGEIPKGWSVSKVETLLSRLSAKTRYTKEQVSQYGQIPVFEQGASVLLGYHQGAAAYQASAVNPMFIFGDHTCVTRLSYQPFDISQNVIPLQGKDRATAWVYYAVKEKQKFQEYRRHWMELISKDVVIATAEICLEFSKRISKLHLQIEANERQMQSLQELRDTLLPKLLSGELSVEALTEAAGVA
jgi:type I restriction enzyme S subunit